MEPVGTTLDTSLQNAGLDAIYVVHYSTDEVRRKYIESLFEERNLTGLLITGWDRERFTDADVTCLYPSNDLYQKTAKARNFVSSWFTTGDLSESMKHAAAYFDAMRKGHRNILVLEDDVILHDDFTIELAKVLQDDALTDYDIIFLGSYYSNSAAERDMVPSTLPDEAPKGAVAYLVSLKGSRWMMDRMPITGPPDHMISNSDSYPNPPPARYARWPWLAWQGSRDSEWIEKHPGANNYKGQEYIWTSDTEDCSGCNCPNPNKITHKSQHILRLGGATGELVKTVLTWKPPSVRRLQRPGNQEGMVLDMDYITQAIDGGKACDIQGLMEYEQSLMNLSAKKFPTRVGAVQSVERVPVV